MTRSVTEACDVAATDVLAFWRQAGSDRWYTRDDVFDAEIRTRYLDLWRKAAAAELSAWEESDDGALALIIVLDQVPRNMFRGDPMTYASLSGRMLLLDIHNGRPDIAALQTTGRLLTYTDLASNTRYESEIPSPLKASGRPGFEHTIFQHSRADFDLLCVGTSTASIAPHEEHVYLNSALDRLPMPHLQITRAGKWSLEYRFCALEFPLLAVVVELDWPQDGLATAKVIQQENL